tara:strand:- start:285 stop:986 length:702 start_codon:yes stop_codon:yes gene_type:complete
MARKKERRWNGKRQARKRRPTKSYEQLQAELSKKELPRQLTNRIEQDLYAEIEADFNLLIQTTVSDLTSDATKGGYSPVLTGFFASNWKAGKGPINRTETPKGTEWEKIKKTTRTIGEKKKTVLFPGQTPIIKQRHEVPEFKLKDRVYIGSAVKYAPYALMSPKSQLINYVAGGGGSTASLNQRINEIMTDKKKNVDIRIGAQAFGGNQEARTQMTQNDDYRPRTGYTKLEGT